MGLSNLQGDKIGTTPANCTGSGTSWKYLTRVSQTPHLFCVCFGEIRQKPAPPFRQRNEIVDGFDLSSPLFLEHEPDKTPTV